MSVIVIYRQLTQTSSFQHGVAVPTRRSGQARSSGMLKTELRHPSHRTDACYCKD
jgi:hypothetical protein